MFNISQVTCGSRSQTWDPRRVPVGLLQGNKELIDLLASSRAVLWDNKGPESVLVTPSRNPSGRRGLAPFPFNKSDEDTAIGRAFSDVPLSSPAPFLNPSAHGRRAAVPFTSPI